MDMEMTTAPFDSIQFESQQLMLNVKEFYFYNFR